MRPDQDSSIKKIGIYMYNNIYLTLTCCLINVESMPCRKCNLGWTICMKDIIQYMYIDRMCCSIQLNSVIYLREGDSWDG